MSDEREGLDALQADMAAHQRAVGQEVAAERNRQLAAQVIERVDKKQAEAKPAPPPAAPPQKLEAKTVKKTIEDRTYTLSVEPEDPTTFRKADDAERWFLQHAMPRIELLMTLQDRGPFNSPSWMERVLAACAWAERNPNRYLAELVTVLEDSNRLFGDWKNDKTPTIYVGGGL